jgi:hypothetical protein
MNAFRMGWFGHQVHLLMKEEQLIQRNCQLLFLRCTLDGALALFCITFFPVLKSFPQNRNRISAFKEACYAISFRAYSTLDSLWNQFH